MSRLPNHNPYLLMEGLKKQGQQFTLKKTLSTLELICVYGTFKWYDKTNILSKKDLYFPRMLRKSLEGFDLSTIETVDISDIKYNVLPVKTFVKTNCYEVDISGAYWNIAKCFLPEHIYRRGLSVDKKVRLAALGGLAKTTTTMFFNGREFVNTSHETEKTKNLFFYCAKETGEIMDSIRQVCDTALFFWVDAMFVESERDLDYIISVLRIKNLGCKVYTCEEIISTEDRMIVRSSEHKKFERVFFKERVTSNFFIGKFKNKLINNGKEK